MLASLAGGATAAGAALVAGRLERGDDPQRPERTTVEVSVFSVERLQKPPIQGDGGDLYRQRLAARALEWALPTLSDDALEVAADVRIVEEPVPEAVVADGDALEAFGEYVRTAAPADAVAADANLLLAHLPGSDADGRGEIPRRGDRPAVAVVHDGLALGQVATAAAARYRYGPHAATLSTVVHEVGHTLGLDHDAGYAWRDTSDPSRVFVTPMLTGYLREAPDENRYGQPLPAVGEDARPVYAPHFNRRIPAATLR